MLGWEVSRTGVWAATKKVWESGDSLLEKSDIKPDRLGSKARHGLGGSWICPEAVVSHPQPQALS